jgi:hypothetical protein
MHCPGATRERVIQKTLEYLDRPSVVGCEQSFLAFLGREFAMLGCTLTRSEGLLEAEAPGGRHEIISCHVDRHGLIATEPGVYEYAAWIAREEHTDEDKPTSPTMATRVSTRFMDEPVLAYNPENGAALARAVIRDAQYDEDEGLIFPIPEFEELPAGTPVCFRRPYELDHDLMTGQIDNAISAAIAFALVERGFGGRILFTTEEEIGRSWLHVRDHLDATHGRTDRLIVLDTSPYPEPKAIDEGLVVLRTRDAHAEFNPELTDEIERACARADIPYQFKDEWIGERNALREKNDEPALSLGSTELGRLVKATEGEITGATIQLPTFGYHSNNESTSTRAIDHTLALLGEVLGVEIE